MENFLDKDAVYYGRCLRFQETPRFVGFGYTLDSSGLHAKFLDDKDYGIFSGTFEEWLQRQEENQRQENELKRLEALHDSLDMVCSEYLRETEALLSETNVLDILEWNWKRIQKFKGEIKTKNENE